MAEIPTTNLSREGVSSADTLSQFYALLADLGDEEAKHPSEGSFVYGLKIVGRLLVGAAVLAALPSLLIWLVIFTGSLFAAWLSSLG